MTLWRRVRVNVPAVVAWAALVVPLGAAAESFDGRLAWRTVMEVRAGVSGRLESPRLVPGQRFEVGDELAVIEAGLYRAQLADAQSRLELSRSEFAIAEEEFEREQILYEEGSLSRVDLEHVRLRMQRAQSGVRQAELALATARLNAELSRFTAPFDGVVLESAASTGEYYNAATVAPVLALIAEHGAFAVSIEVDAQRRRSLAPRTPARVTVGETVFDAEVGAVRSREDGAWLIEVYVDDGGGDLVPGLPARVELP